MKKMDKESQLYIRKVRLKLIQPDIICDGRDRVESYYKGKIIDLGQYSLKVEFRYKGNTIQEWYDKRTGFMNKELQDIKIVE